MASISANKARAHLDEFIDQVNGQSQEIVISGRGNNAVLVGENQWRGIQETLFLLSIPEMARSIHKARREGLENALPDLDW